MIVANGIGCALFLLIIRSVLNEEEKVAAQQAQASDCPQNHWVYASG